MPNSYLSILEEFVISTKSGSVSQAEILEQQLRDQSENVRQYFVRSAELDAAAQLPARAADKWLAASLLRPADLGIQRQRINALTAGGDIDRGFYELRKVDPLGHGFDHFYWALNKFLGMHEWDEAFGLMDAARACGRFSDDQLTAAQAITQLESGLDISAEAGFRKVSHGQDIASQHSMRALARIVGQRGDYDGSADIYAQMAIEFGTFGDLHAAVGLRELLLRYDVGLAEIARFLAKWPHFANAAKPLTLRLEQLRDKAVAAVAAIGPLVPSDPERVFNWLRGGRSEHEVLWARQGLIAMADRATLPQGMVSKFLSPLGAWEDWRVNRHIGLCYLKQFPDDVVLLGRRIRTLALDQTLRETLFSNLLRIPEHQFDEDTLLYAVHYFRQSNLAHPRTREVLQEKMAALHEKIASVISKASPDFRAFARAQISALGLNSNVADGAESTLDIRRHMHWNSVVGQTPWNQAKVSCSAVFARRRAASVVVAHSGQMRGFERAWPTVHEYIVKPLRAPVAISLWDTSQNAVGRHANRLERTLPADILARIPPLERFTDIFQEKYPLTAGMIFGKIPVSAPSIEVMVRSFGVREYYIETESESTYDQILVRNNALSTHSILKMFAKFHRVDQIIEAMEAERGEVFTHVCWSRPDARLNRFSRRELERWTLDFETGWGEAVRPNMVGDYIFFVPRQIFRAIANIFPAAILTNDINLMGWNPMPTSRVSREGEDWPLCGPETLASALFASGITLKEIRNVQVELLGYIPEEESLRRCFNEEYDARK